MQHDESRWYGLMLPDNHPPRCCQLLNLTSEEHDCFFQACGFVKRVGGCRKGRRPSSRGTPLPVSLHQLWVFTPFILRLVDSSVKAWVVSVGSHKKQLQASFRKQETAYRIGKRLVLYGIEAMYCNAIKALAK